MKHPCHADRRSHRGLLAVLLMLCLLVSGCQEAQERREPGAELMVTSAKPDSDAPRLALDAGDVLEIKFYYTPELNETQTVRPDGYITLQLIGEIKAQGVTPEELKQQLLDKYSSHLKNPEIAVIVRQLEDRRVFVGGAVVSPGIVDMPGNLSVLEAVMAAGGFNMVEAQVKNVLVIRHIDDKRYAQSINLKPALDNRPTEQFFLAPRDIVYVPRTEIVKIGQWVDQHINRIIPDIGLVYTRTSGATTVGIRNSR